MGGGIIHKTLIRVAIPKKMSQSFGAFPYPLPTSTHTFTFILLLVGLICYHNPYLSDFFFGIASIIPRVQHVVIVKRMLSLRHLFEGSLQRAGKKVPPPHPISILHPKIHGLSQIVQCSDWLLGFVWKIGCGQKIFVSWDRFDCPALPSINLAAFLLFADAWPKLSRLENTTFDTLCSRTSDH